MRYIESIYEVYGGFDGDELSYLSKMDDPWNEARVGIPFYEPSVNKIEDYMIKMYYSMLL